MPNSTTPSGYLKRPSSGVRRWICIAILAPLIGTPVYSEPPPTRAPPSAGQVRPPTGQSAAAQASPPPVQVTLRGFMVVDMSYNTSPGLFPGSQAAFAVRSDVGQPQFFLSPQNSVLGIDLKANAIEGMEIIGALAITLRSPQPLITANTISPQFYDVHVEAKTKTLRVAFGQMPDVVYPTTPDVLNGAPPGYLPGAIGYTRPQLAANIDAPLGEVVTLLLRGSVAQPVQTFQVSDELVGRQAGWPDFQGRVALGNGEPVATGAVIRPRERPIEIGVDAHWGRRRVTLLPPSVGDFTFTTWSVGGDLHAKLPSGTTLRGEVFVGSLLGDYQAGVFHTVDPTLVVAVRAWGFWAQIVHGHLVAWGCGRVFGFRRPLNPQGSPARLLARQLLLSEIHPTVEWCTEAPAPKK